jgi:hypothetical protein
MAKLSRINQKVFGETGGTSEFGAFGSDALGTPTTTKNLETIQSLAPFLQGLYAGTASANEPPRIQDINGLYFLFSSQLRYLFQNGVPEWIATAEYYNLVSFCQVNGVIYQSTYGTDGTPNLNHTPVGDDGTYWVRFIDTVAESPSNDKRIIEKRFPRGMIFPMMHYQAPHEWDEGDPDTYFPALCLTNFDTHTDISATNWGQDAIDYLRSLKVTYKDGLSGALTSFGVTAWAISSNVATLTFTNDAAHMAFLSALLEDETSYASYLRTVTLGSTIGDITSGDYLLTNINAGSRTVSFGFTHANSSGSGSFSVDFYANRIAGSTTTARVFSARGRAIHGAGDDNGYMVSGLARRGFGQGHWHFETISGSVIVNSSGNGPLTAGIAGSSGTAITNPANMATTMYSDGTNGTPRVAKDTNSPAFSMHLYLQLCHYEAA